MPALLDILGQDRAIAGLQRLLTGARRPHALIFEGPRGVGRRTTAEALAAVLLCGQPVRKPNGRLADVAETIEACGTCEDCRMTAAGGHPDFHTVTKEMAAYHDSSAVRNRVMQELGIEVVRQFLIAPANQAAARGHGKVFVVREAELMSIPAQNALLKTLEEPPPGVTSILLTRSAQLLLPTTLSRCALVRFGPLPVAIVTDRLIANGLDPAEAAFWATFTDGSIGRAMDLAAQEMYPVKQDLLQRLAELQRGGDEDLAEHLVKLTDTFAEGLVSASRKADGPTLSKNLATRQATGTLLQLIGSVYRDALTLTAEIDRPLCHDDQPESIRAVAGRFSPTQLAEIIEQLSAFEQMLWRNVNAKLVWDNAVITCASAAPLRA